jgi:hypothetical protein
LTITATQATKTTGARLRTRVAAEIGGQARPRSDRPGGTLTRTEGTRRGWTIPPSGGLDGNR